MQRRRRPGAVMGDYGWFDLLGPEYAAPWSFGVFEVEEEARRYWIDGDHREGREPSDLWRTAEYWRFERGFSWRDAHRAGREACAWFLAWEKEVGYWDLIRTEPRPPRPVDPPPLVPLYEGDDVAADDEKYLLEIPEETAKRIEQWRIVRERNARAAASRRRRR